MSYGGYLGFWKREWRIRPSVKVTGSSTNGKFSSPFGIVEKPLGTIYGGRYRQ